jgi:hypothetical protein
MTPVDIIKTISSADGERRLHIYRHGDFFAFAEDVDAKTVGGRGWMPVTSPSGVYDSVETAEREAVAQVDWLQGAGSL